MLLRPCASATRADSVRVPAEAAAGTVARKLKVPSPATASPFWPASLNACVADRPRLERSLVTARPVLAGPVPAVTRTVSRLDSPASRLFGLAAAAPNGATLGTTGAGLVTVTATDVEAERPCASIAVMRTLRAPAVAVLATVWRKLKMPSPATASPFRPLSRRRWLRLPPRASRSAVTPMPVLVGFCAGATRAVIRVTAAGATELGVARPVTPPVAGGATCALASSGRASRAAASGRRRKFVVFIAKTPEMSACGARSDAQASARGIAVNGPAAGPPNGGWNPERHSLLGQRAPWRIRGSGSGARLGESTRPSWPFRAPQTGAGTTASGWRPLVRVPALRKAGVVLRWRALSRCKNMQTGSWDTLPLTDVENCQPLHDCAARPDIPLTFQRRNVHEKA